MTSILHPDQPRPPARSRPARPLLVTAVALVVLLAFLAGLGVGHEHRPATATSPSATPRPVSAAPNHGAVPTGPTRVMAGVPVGYAHTPAGAVAAATTYLTRLFATPAVLDESRRDAALRAIAAPEAVEHLRQMWAAIVAQVDRSSGLTSAATNGTPTLLQALPAGYRLLSYDPDHARVAIWTAGLVGNSGAVPVRETWTTSTIQLRWAAGDWKYLASTSSDGPTPLGSEAAASPGTAVVSQASTFTRYRYAP